MIIMIVILSTLCILAGISPLLVTEETRDIVCLEMAARTAQYRWRNRSGTMPAGHRSGHTGVF